jgi:2-polyprenyl-3-methyl-5-hydroxy-6-metoxy-1,4-benzoquinol methylase
VGRAERDYERLAERFWNLPQKGEEEARREQFFMDDIIQKAHLDRKVAGLLEGVETAFDGGAGTGRFSIPLAQRGIHVTRFDISAPMVSKAKELVRGAGVEDRITFVQGALTDVSSRALCPPTSRGKRPPVWRSAQAAVLVRTRKAGFSARCRS